MLRHFPSILWKVHSSIIHHKVSRLYVAWNRKLRGILLSPSWSSPKRSNFELPRSVRYEKGIGENETRLIASQSFVEFALDRKMAFPSWIAFALYLATLTYAAQFPLLGSKAGVQKELHLDDAPFVAGQFTRKNQSSEICSTYHEKQYTGSVDVTAQRRLFYCLLSSQRTA